MKGGIIINLTTFIAGIVESITTSWTTLASSAGGIIVMVSAGTAVIGYAVSGLWRMFSKKKKGGRG